MDLEYNENEDTVCVHTFGDVIRWLESERRGYLKSEAFRRASVWAEAERDAWHHRAWSLHLRHPDRELQTGIADAWDDTRIACQAAGWALLTIDYRY